MSKLAHRTQSVDSTRGGVSLGGSNGNRSNSISLESLDDEDHLEVEFVGNLPAGLAAAAPTPTAHTPAVHTPAPVTAAGGINLGVIAGIQAGQRAQANVAFVGNLPAGLAAAAPTPTAHTPAVRTPTPVKAARGINLGVIAGIQAGQRAQANVAAGNIGNLQVFPSGVHMSRNLDQVNLLAHMNQEVARGIANLNSFFAS